MNPLNLDEVNEFVNENIVDFHQQRLKSLETLTLNKLLKKNPYLLKAKHVTTAIDFVDGFLDAFLSSSEEKLFGDFLEELALFVAGKTTGGHKSTAPGADLEFINREVYYIVSIKSGPNWGNSSQQNKLQEDMQKAARRVKQSRAGINVQPVLGICYGKTRTDYLRGYLKVVGQNFWYLISENKELYTDIIEPIGYRAKEQNDAFLSQKGRIRNRLHKEFMNRFYEDDGQIDWPILLHHTSGNYDLDKFTL
ncbi:MAG: cytosolic protein [Chloroflexi bacterium]|nr:cytosolic protein [Chloroflexota bacterium]MBU1660185.1 cytosolic protein [Chloroflexota bacterium]